MRNGDGNIAFDIMHEMISNIAVATNNKRIRLDTVLFIISPVFSGDFFV